MPDQGLGPLRNGTASGQAGVAQRIALARLRCGPLVLGTGSRSQAHQEAILTRRAAEVEPMTRDLLHYLATQLVDFPDDVRVEEEQTPDGKVLRLSVRREDVGKVIGKQGRTARALRNLVHAAALVRQERVNVQFVDA